jgi:hypothetical protein
VTFPNAYLTNTIFSAVVTNVLGSVTSAPAVPTVNPVGTSIATYAGVTINGGVGFTYGIQGSSNLSDTNTWRGLTNLVLTATNEIWVDLSSPANRTFQYYRVLPGPISIP